jgi:hypothetical protein
MKDLKIIEIMELFDEGEVIPASEMQRPQSALDREMFQDANERFNQADGGRIGFKFGTQGEPQRLSLINNLKSAIAEAEKTKNYNLLKSTRRDTGGILSEQTAKFLNRAAEDKNFAKKFAKELGISTKKLNSLLDKRATAIQEYGRIASQKSSLKRVDPLKIKMINLINEGVNDTSLLAKKLKVSRAKVNQIGNALYKDIYATSSAIGKGATKTTGTGVATFLPDNAKDLNSLLKKMHNVKGLETVEQRQIKKLLVDAFGDGKNPKLFKLYDDKIKEYYNIKNKLAGNINLNLDHPLSSQMIKNLKLGKEAMLFVEPLTAEINQGTKALLDKTYAKAFASKSPDRTAKMKAVVNLAKKIQLPLGTTKIISEPFYKQNIPKKIIKAAETQNRVLKNIKNLPKEEIQKVFPDKRSKLISPDVKEIDINNLRNLMVELGCGKRGQFSKGTSCEIKGRKKLETIIKTGVKEGAPDGALARQILKAGAGLKSAFALKNIFGPAAIAFTVATEAGLVGYDMLSSGKTFKETIGDSLFNYALGEKTKIDPNKELIKRFGTLEGMTEDKLLGIKNVLKQTNTLNTILKQDLKVADLADQVKFQNQQSKDTFMSPDDEMLQSDTAMRTRQSLEDEQQKLKEILTNYRSKPPVGLSMEDTIIGNMASDQFFKEKQDLADAVKAAEIQKLESKGPVFMGKVFPKFEEGRQEKLLNLRAVDNPAVEYSQANRFMYPFGLAGGGIAKLAGIDEGPQTVSMNPDSQGLQSLKNRVKNV